MSKASKSSACYLEYLGYELDKKKVLKKGDLRNYCFSFFFVMRSQKLNFYISKYVPIMK